MHIVFQTILNITYYKINFISHLFHLIIHLSFYGWRHYVNRSQYTNL